MQNGLASQLTNFFQAMQLRMVARAVAQNRGGTNSIGSAPNGSGDFGAGALPIGSIAVYPDAKTEDYIKNAYSGNSTIYTIVSYIARKFAYLPRYVYKIEDKSAERAYKHYIRNIDSRHIQPFKIKSLFQKAYSDAETTSVSQQLTDLLTRPNPKQGQDQFFELAAIYYETAGEAVIWCNRGSDAQDLPLTEGVILEMWVLPTQYMEMVPDPYNVWGDLGWIFNVAGKRIPIDSENIIHWKKPNPNFDGVTREHMRGLSTLRAGNKKLTEDESATDASVAMNQNEGAKGIAFDKNPGKLTPEKETAMRGAVDRKVNQRDLRGAVAWLQGDLGYLDLSMSSTDQELELRKSNLFDRLCNLFGMPPDLFKTGQTYQNVLQARKDAMTNKIIPMACNFQDELSRVLLPAFKMSPRSYKIDIDATQIVELQDDMTAQTTALAAAWWLTPNERRQEQNQEVSDAEGMDDIWIINTMTKMEDAAQPQDDPNSFDPNMPTPQAGQQSGQQQSAAK